MEKLRRYLKHRRVMLIMAGFLVLGSGCAGVVKETGDQLTDDALSPVTVPIHQGTKAINALEDIQSAQEARNAELEDIR